MILSSDNEQVKRPDYLYFSAKYIFGCQVVMLLCDPEAGDRLKSFVTPHCVAWEKY